MGVCSSTITKSSCANYECSHTHTHTHLSKHHPVFSTLCLMCHQKQACHVQSFQANWCVSPNKKAQPALYVVQNRSRLPLAALCKYSLTQFVACPAAGLGLLRLLGVDKTKDDLWHCIASFFSASVSDVNAQLHQAVSTVPHPQW